MRLVILILLITVLSARAQKGHIQNVSTFVAVPDTLLEIDSNIVGNYLLIKTSWDQTMYEQDIFVLVIKRTGEEYLAFHGEKVGENIVYDEEWGYELSLDADGMLVHEYGVFSMRLKQKGGQLDGEGDIAAGEGIVKLLFQKME